MCRKSQSVLVCVLVLLLAVTVAVGCSSASASSNGLALQQADNGKSFTVNVGDSIKLILTGNPTTGFNWQVVTPQGSAPVVQQVGDATFQASNNAIGAGGNLAFEFRAVAKGDTALKLVYSRPWESVPPAQTFQVTITVK